METEAVMRALIELSLATAGGEPDKAKLLVYAKHLSDLKAERVIRACNELARSSRWFPSVAEIRDTAAGRRDDPRLGAPSPAARQFWCSECFTTHRAGFTHAPTRRLA